MSKDLTWVARLLAAYYQNTCCVCGKYFTGTNGMYYKGLKLGICKDCRWTKEFSEKVRVAAEIARCERA